MGNSHSSVEPLPRQQQDRQDTPTNPKPAKRQPQKLSKPRVGNHTSSSRRPSANLVTTGGSSPQLAVNQNNALPRQTTWPSPSPVSPQPLASPANPTDVAEPQQDDEPAPSSVSGEVSRRFSLFRSKGSREDLRSRRKSAALLAPSMPGEKPSRPKSVNWESQANLEHARQRVESWNTPGNRTSANFDVSSYEASRLFNQTEAPLSPETEPDIPDTQKPEVSPNTWKSSSPCEESVVSPTLGRVDSDVALYAPVRRRSVIQTPGLATRSPEDDVAPRGSSMQYSHPPAPVPNGDAIQEPLDSSDSRVTSLPPPFQILAPDDTDRVPTPSEGHYKQLGAMTFGSLRITNGAASPIPSIDGDRRRAGETALTAGDIGLEEQYPQSRASAALGGQRLEKTDNASATQPKGSQAVVPAQGANSTVHAVFASEQTPSPTTPEIDTTSKHTAVEDDLFGDQAPPECTSPEVLDIRDVPNAKSTLERPIANPTEQLEQLARSDSGIVATPTSDQSYKPLSKADSGYSSSVSLRSVRSKPSSPEAEEASRTALENSDEGPSDLRGAGPEGANDSASPTKTKLVVDTTTFEILTGSRPSPTSGDDSPVSAGSVASLNSQQADMPPRSSHDGVHKASQNQHQPGSVKASEGLEGLGIVLPEGPRPPESTGSTLSIGISPNFSRKTKLQRLLSGSGLRNAPPSVHPTHAVEKTVPSVPQHVEARLNDHTGRYPTATKRLAPRSQKSKDTLKTIMSVDSVENFTSAGRNSRLIHEDDDTLAEPTETPKSQRRRSLQSAASLISRSSSIRRKPAGADRDTGEDWIQDGFESHATSIESIRNSVGKSAFDSAFAALPSQQHQGQQQPPPRRSMTLDVRVERDMGLRRHPSMSTRYGTTSPIPEVPDMSPAMFKSKTPPPISIQNRSAKSLRKRPFLRPRSSPIGLAPGSISRKSSRESLGDGPSAPHPDVDSSAPPVPPISPEYAAQQYPEFQHLLQASPPPNRESWQPPHHQGACPESTPKRGPNPSTYPHPYPHPGAGPRRPASATARPNPHDLRHYPNYDGYGGGPGGLRTGPPPPRHHPGSADMAYDGSYYQNQLLQLQDDHFGANGWDEEGRYLRFVGQGKPAPSAPGNRSRGSLTKA